MKETLLLFGGDIILENRLRKAAEPMGAEVRKIPTAQYSQPIGRLLGDTLLPEIAPYTGGAFAKPMLLLGGFVPLTGGKNPFFSVDSPRLEQMLDALDAARLPLEYRAVVTAFNRQMSAAALYAELKQEHEALHRPGK